MVKVPNLSPIITLCRKHHIPIAVPPRHYYWGTLELVIKDPDGVVLVFIAPYSTRAARQLHADERWAKSPPIV